MKEYEGGRYSFLALLPNEGVSLEDYIASLSGDSLSRTLAQAQYCSVNTMVPKLRLECSLEAAEVLDAMGMKEAFTMNADFSHIEPEKLLYISRILHKTTLTVDEAGTEAGAVTVEEFALKNSPMREKSVVLNRPFLMGIYDNVNHCFLFLSAVETPG
jgi:serpin B